MKIRSFFSPVTLGSICAALAIAAAPGCKQTVLAGANDGGGGAGTTSSTGSTTTASSTSTGGGDPGAMGASTCAKRAACETVDPTCVDEYTCYYAFFREELWPIVEPCFSACGAFDDCFYGVAQKEPAPATYATYAPQCQAKLVTACGLGDDWCAYNAFDGADYDAMVPCLDLPCDEIVDCFRTIVFADAPTCTSI